MLSQSRRRKGKGERKQGAQNYSVKDLDALLDVIDMHHLLPCCSGIVSQSSTMKAMPKLTAGRPEKKKASKTSSTKCTLGLQEEGSNLDNNDEEANNNYNDEVAKEDLDMDITIDPSLHLHEAVE
ncbi:hypothetical protein RUND412_001305, partial [Rhizina undulata]